MKMKNKSKGMEGESGCDVKLIPGLLRRLRRFDNAASSRKIKGETLHSR